MNFSLAQLKSEIMICFYIEFYMENQVYTGNQNMQQIMKVPITAIYTEKRAQGTAK